MFVEPCAEEPEWSRERPECFWDPGRRLLQTVRKFQFWSQRKGLIARLMVKLWSVQHRFWSIVTGADIPLECQIGGGLLIPHPTGIVLHPDCRIGPNCLIFQQVTVGMLDRSDVPTIGGHVDIGAGARVLGEITIGDHSKIGANAVVLSSFPPRSVVVGIPARRVGESDDNEPSGSHSVRAATLP